MPYYTSLGEIPPKRHIQFRRPDGVLYSEEVFGTEGFDGPTSTMYHIHPPTQVSGWKHEYSTKQEYVETNVMRMRHLVSKKMTAGGDPITGRTVLFGNGDCEMGVCVPEKGMDYHFKNGQGDESLFIHDGTGTCHTMFGTLKFKKFDFVIIPKGTIYKMVFDDAPSDGPENRFMFIETANASHILPPKRYIAEKTSQFLEHAPYCERDLRIPQMPLVYDEMGEFEVRIKALNSVHSYMYPYHPLDIVGWDGCYYPYCFNALDFSPIVAKHHMPPPTHQVFAGGNFVICAFAPRMLDFHPEAIKVPYNHSNVDSDEVMYYCDNKYTARKGIGEGSMTMHPQGIAHGPHPGTVEATLDQTYTDELVVMCDTFRPLFPTKAAIDIDDDAYPKSWEDWKPIPVGQ
ncbi:MAG: homogentisate 1,2-dioxygenase [Planctomycetes bacterium]|nr:homogentisate 1,2-dioxygenase [Planctomycetota bacterium]